MNSTHLVRQGEEPCDRQRLLLTSLADKGFTKLFRNMEKLELQDRSFEERETMVRLLSRLLKAGFPLVVYSGSGNRYGLRSVRLNKEGCVGLTLMVTKTEVQPLTLKPLLLRFYPGAAADMSFFTLTSDPSFSLPSDLELLQQSLLFYEVEEEQPSTEGYEKKMKYVQSAEEQEEQRLVKSFIRSFSLQGSGPLYIFFRVSRFNALEENSRNGLLSQGSAALKEGIDLIV